MTDLGTLPGGNISLGYGINASGQVTGSAEVAHGINNVLISPQAFIVDMSGEMKPVTGWPGSAGIGINNDGRVVGTITNGSHNLEGDAFVSGPNGSDAVIIAGLRSDGATGTDINASGQAVGHALISSIFPHAFITSSNHVSVLDLGTLGGNRSLAAAVNDSGQVVGNSETVQQIEAPFHAFIVDATSAMKDLGTLGGRSSQAMDINSHGVVVGSADTDVGNRKHAFITGPDGNNMVDLNDLVKLEKGAFFVDATGINDRGQIVANANDGQAYLLTPVPEPETYALLLAGLGLIGFMARRKKIA